LRAGAGSNNAQQILKLAEQSTENSTISDDDGKWLLSTIEVALKQSAVTNDNGARAVRCKHSFAVVCMRKCLTVSLCLVSGKGIGINQVDCRQRCEVCQTWWAT
jgi:hypothetical protein